VKITVLLGLKILISQYDMIVYDVWNSGDHDLVVPFFGTQAWIRSLNYSIVEDWRSWVVQGQVAG